MNKKAAELSMNVIIITVILLVVLVVLIYIFSGGAKNFTTSIENCVAKQGRCVDVGTCAGPTFSPTDCDKKETPQICCLIV